jgi:hypothetical protein
VLIVAVGQDAAHVLAGIEREDLEVRIAEVSENIRTLVEEATAVNGASDDDSVQAGIPAFRSRLSFERRLPSFTSAPRPPLRRSARILVVRYRPPPSARRRPFHEHVPLRVPTRA